MKKVWLVKTLALAVVVLFFITTVSSTIGISNYLDDTTPPVTTIFFDPPEPDGENGWYVSIVTVTLNATDDDSGVNTTYYRIDYGILQVYLEPFNLTIDGYRVIIYYSIDNAGNQEEVKSAVIDIDQTEPRIDLCYEVTGGDPEHGWEFTFTATAVDDTSGMERVEFYFDDVLQETVVGAGPTYLWVYNFFPYTGLNVRGLILNPEITDDYVKFFAIFVIAFKVVPHFPTICANAYDNAGNMGRYCIEEPTLLSISPGIYIFKNLTLPNDYKGYIGKFFIRATFDV